MPCAYSNSLLGRGGAGRGGMDGLETYRLHIAVNLRKHKAQDRLYRYECHKRDATSKYHQ